MALTRPTLGRLARRLGVGDDVLFTGPVPWPELPGYYDAADVFAMPCRTRRAGLDVEGLGIVYLEASATGLPVIGGDSGGAPDAILDGETGYVVQRCARAAARITELLCDPAKARAMGEKGLAWVDGSGARNSPPPAWPRSWSARPGSTETHEYTDSRVQRIDVGGEVLQQHAPADPELHAELARLLGEVHVENPELPDGFGPGHRLVGVVDGMLYVGDEIRVVAQRRDRARRQACRASPSMARAPRRPA